MINWKLRLKRLDFWVELLALVGILIQNMGIDLPDNYAAVVNSFLSIAVLVGLVTDPTTKGLEDSDRAMSYDEPE